jgi:hypothetical protein
MKTKKAIITITLVEESQQKANQEIENEILQELTPQQIPWCRKIETVKIIE